MGWETNCQLGVGMGTSERDSCDLLSFKETLVHCTSSILLGGKVGKKIRFECARRRVLLLPRPLALKVSSFAVSRDETYCRFCLPDISAHLREEEEGAEGGPERSSTILLPPLIR